MLPLTLPVLGFACKPTSVKAVTPRSCGRKEHISMLPSTSPWPLLFNADTSLYLVKKGQVSREDKQELREVRELWVLIHTLPPLCFVTLDL